MNDSVKKPDDTSDTDTDTNGGANDANDPVKPAVAAPVANATTNANNNNAEAQQGGKLSRELGKESAELAQEKKPELTLSEKLHELMNQFASYQLKPEIMAEAVNGLAGKVMANLTITAQEIDGMVQKVDPIAHVVKHLRDAGVGGAVQVADSRSAQLPSQAVGASVSLGATLQMNS
jgi:hypothetical protein